MIAARFFLMHEDDELITIKEACRLLGGNERPIHNATYYRGVARGLYPPLVHPSPGISRVSKRAVLDLRARIIGGDHV
jgi:hypothetical protein